MSCTVTVNEAEPVLPSASVAEQGITWTPSAKSEPDAGGPQVATIGLFVGGSTALADP